jgi:hypothetical protein
MAFLTEEQEEIREAIWQKHKPEENAIIREIEEARRVWTELQGKYKLFEARVTAEVDAALKPVSATVAVVPTVDITTIVKIKVKCSLCKAEGHNKRSCKTTIEKKIETINPK